MTPTDIAHQRLHTQHIAGPPLGKPEEVVSWLVAVQAQDYPAAQWALGLRMGDARDSQVEEAFAAGRILRTHVMRPTWHFVTPDDIRWLLQLTAPRVHTVNAYMYRKAGLDNALLARSGNLIEKALEGGKHLTRTELSAILERDGIPTGGEFRLGYILHHAELEQIVCSGPKRGKQFTYALLEERAPQARRLEPDEALAQFVRRYFTAHGPATAKDFAWWSGLAMSDVKAGLEAVREDLLHEDIDGQTYWFAETPTFKRNPTPTAYLLPNYDEYGISYRDHSAFSEKVTAARIAGGREIYFGHAIVIDGQIVGAWKRTLGKSEVTVTLETFQELTGAEYAAVSDAARRYGVFLGLDVIMV